MSLPQGACVMELLSSVAQFSGHSHLLARTPMKLLTYNQIYHNLMHDLHYMTSNMCHSYLTTSS